MLSHAFSKFKIHSQPTLIISKVVKILQFWIEFYVISLWPFTILHQLMKIFTPESWCMKSCLGFCLRCEWWWEPSCCCPPRHRLAGERRFGETLWKMSPMSVRLTSFSFSSLIFWDKKESVFIEFDEFECRLLSLISILMGTLIMFLFPPASVSAVPAVPPIWKL